MTFSIFLKTLYSKTKRDIVFLSIAAILFAVALVTDKILSPKLWLYSILYFLPLLALLTKLAEKAINSKNNDSISRHWVLFASGIIMFGSTFIPNGERHCHDAVIMLLIYGAGDIIAEAFLTIVRNQHLRKHSHTHADILQNEDNTLASTNKHKAGGIATANKGETKENEDDHKCGKSSNSIIKKVTRNNEWPKTMKMAKRMSQLLIMLALPGAVITATIVPTMATWFILAFPRWVYRASMIVAIAYCNTITFSLTIAMAETIIKMLNDDIIINRYKIVDRMVKARSLLFDSDILHNSTLTPSEVKDLQRQGVKHIVMMSSGNKNDTEALARETGIRSYRYDMQPEDKMKLAKQMFRHRKKHTCFISVGNGVSDKRIIQQSSIRIAMTQPDNSTAIESVDIAILDGKFAKITIAIKASKKLIRTNWFNIIFSSLSKVVLMGLAFWGLAPIWILALADIGVLSLTSLNSFRTLR